MKTLISIPTPCHENWESMQKEERSRFCNSCQKSVMDFTDMNQNEIQSFFEVNKGQKVCGRFEKSQLSFPSSYPEIKVFPIYKSKQHSSIPFYLLTASTLFLASCSSKKQPTVKGEVETKQGTITHTLGMPVIENEKTTCEKGKEKTTSSKAKENDGDTVFYESPNTHFIMGDVAAPEPKKDPNAIHIFVDEAAEFPGGYNELTNYIKSNLQYPKWEQENKIEGKVYVRFVVSKLGLVESIRITRGVEGSKNFDAEVVRLLKSMPNWKPASDKGVVVASYFDLPISFKL